MPFSSAKSRAILVRHALSTDITLLHRLRASLPHHIPFQRNNVMAYDQICPLQTFQLPCQSTIFRSPLSAATCNTVPSPLSRAGMTATFSESHSTIWVEPLSTAQCSNVFPFLSVNDISAPREECCVLFAKNCLTLPPRQLVQGQSHHPNDESKFDSGTTAGL